MSYKAFRAKYPQGCLNTQLLQIDRGLYIVQCLISDGNRTIASGLAGDRTIETAEDRAIERALRLLSIADNSDIKSYVKSYFGNSAPEMSVVIENNEITEECKKKRERYKEQTLQKEDVLSKEKAAEVAFNIINSAKQQIEDAKSIEKVFSADIFNDIFNTESIIPAVTELGEEQQTTESSETQQTKEGFDFSSVIAKTNTELKRLNWSTQQGREYLMSKYGKRSRQLLSDEELLDFLHYLEAQPTEMEI